MNSIVWQPKHPENTHMFKFMRFIEKKHKVHLLNYQQLYTWSITATSLFWQSLCDYFQLQFDSPPESILSSFNHLLDARWFTGATFNFAEKLLARKDNHPAIISINENGQRQILSYHKLRQEVAYCAAGLKQAGISAGDRVVAVMPNVAYTIIAMLATASIGATWSACSPDFGAQAIIDRLGQLEPKILFACDGHQYLGKKHEAQSNLLEISQAIPSLTRIVICPNLHTQPSFNWPAQAIYWQDFIKPAVNEFRPMPFSHPLYILFSSGTTGKPKCIVHGAGGTLLQHLKELGLHTDLNHNDNLCFYTTCGWMMWNWMVSVLALGATLTLYEGAPNYPDINRLFQLIEDEQISVFGTSAKFISSVEKSGTQPNKRYSLNSLRTILSTGSPLLPQNYNFVYQHIKSDVQLSSISGGTDILSCFALGNPLLPVYCGELQCIGLGMAVHVFDEQGQSIHEKRGELVCTQPVPSMPLYFWNDPDQTLYRHAYFERFPGVWTHGDFAEITQHQGLIIYGRSDALLKPGGIRIGTAEIYRQVEKIPEIIDSVVIGQDWQNDVRIILFVKLRTGLTLDNQLIQTIQQTIRNQASPRHVPAKILQVNDIPRTINGKVVEIAVRQMVHGQAISNLQSLANPESLQDFKERIELTS